MMTDERAADPATPTSGGKAELQVALDAVREALRGLRFGYVTITVQDGVVVQVDRTEKRRVRGEK